MVASGRSVCTARATAVVSIPFIAGQWSLLPAYTAPRSTRAPCRFNPLHCGAVVASSAAPRLLVRGDVFQSPSLRGSGRFVSDHSVLWIVTVSIPFIAGQWSLRIAPSPYGGGQGGVSIPFIAGQWSLPAARLLPVTRETIAFQSPSLRGSGRFARAAEAEARAATRFNPLHCGAVVASNSMPPPSGGGATCFNPLHCGAVVASAVRANARPPQPSCFNPLHCGAVVASRR